MHWFDVKESYFNGYRSAMDPFYKDPNGVIFDYEERSTVYSKPFYSEAMKDSIDVEGRKYMFGSNADWQACKQQLQALNSYGKYLK